MHLRCIDEIQDRPYSGTLNDRSVDLNLSDKARAVAMSLQVVSWQANYANNPGGLVEPPLP